MYFNEFYNKLNEFADKHGLGIRHINNNTFAYVNLFPLTNKNELWLFVIVHYTQPNFHEIRYLDGTLSEYHVTEYNDNVIPETLFSKIQTAYKEATVSIKNIPFKMKLEDLKRDFE